mmetsp:Transcript_12812/g.27794  ORF Transcript_12812/g.27794 Transcript_12812/m.27794 type:complete len:120 (-) Transcript_12812:815-1174(-)
MTPEERFLNDHHNASSLSNSSKVKDKPPKIKSSVSPIRTRNNSYNGNVNVKNNSSIVSKTKLKTSFNGMDANSNLLELNQIYSSNISSWDKVNEKIAQVCSYSYSHYMAFVHKKTLVLG